MTSATIVTSKRRKGKHWDAKSYPYQVDYCDQFETPRQAYADIAPLIHQLLVNSQGDSTNIRVYDPYYCNGRSAVLINELGFTAIHEKRDFYQDIQEGTIPEYDILVTNPPYSDDHKKKCLDFCFQQLRGSKQRPFAILMPNYVAARQYYHTILKAGLSDKEEVVYLIPSSRYDYDHPEGTGKAASPFQSLWFLGVGAENVARLKECWDKLDTTNELVLTLNDLSIHNDLVGLFQRRPNPRRRRKKRKAPRDESAALSEPVKNETKRQNFSSDSTSKVRRTNKASKYRDENGKRKRGRF